jgi:hypothetical protein
MYRVSSYSTILFWAQNTDYSSQHGDELAVKLGKVATILGSSNSSPLTSWRSTGHSFRSHSGSGSSHIYSTVRGSRPMASRLTASRATTRFRAGSVVASPLTLFSNGAGR